MIHHDSVVTQGTIGCLAQTGILAGQSRVQFKAPAVRLPGYPARIISYLPLSHIAGSLFDFLLLGRQCGVAEWGSCKWGPTLLDPRFPVFMAGTRKLPSAVYFARPYDLKEMTLAARLQSLDCKQQ